jgi:hypothetical protein
MPHEVCLIGSPLLGPTVWAPVRDRLEAAGRAVRIVSTTRAASGDPELILEELLDQIPTDVRVILVAHSNAGAYIPSIASGRRTAALVFVDAILPAASGSTPLAQPDFLAALAAMANSSGVLPPWTQWWDPAEVVALVPDDGMRDRIEAEQPRIPLGYFRRSLPAPLGWDDRPGAYVAFGTTYESELGDAKSRGWDTRVLDGEHLAMVADPDAVAAALLEVIADFGG